MCFLVISRSGLFIFVYVKPHLLIFSNTSFRLSLIFTFNTNLVLMSIFNNNYSLVSNSNFTSNAIYMFIFTTYLTLILYTFYQQPHTTILPQLFNNHFWQHFRFFATFHQPTTNSTFSNQPSNSNFLLSSIFN